MPPPLQCIAGSSPLYFPTKEAIMVIFFDIDGTIIDDATQVIPASAASAIAALVRRYSAKFPAMKFSSDFYSLKKFCHRFP